MADRMLIHHSLGHPGTCNQQGHTGDLIVHHRPLCIQTVTLQGIPMVGSIDHQGIGSIFADALHHPPQLGVCKGIAAQESGHSNLDRIPVSLPVSSRPDLILGLSLQRIPHIGRFGEFIAVEHGGIGFRAEHGLVRFVQGHRQKEVLFSVFFQEVNGPLSTAVSESKIRLHALPAGLILPGGHSLLLRQFFQVIPHVIPVLRVPALRADSQPKIVSPVQMPFPHIGRADPIVG